MEMGTKKVGGMASKILLVLRLIRVFQKDGWNRREWPGVSDGGGNDDEP